MASATERARTILPQGGTLTREAFEHRHRLLRALLVAHVPALLIFGLTRGVDPVHALGASVVVPAACWLLSARAGSRRVRAVLCTAGLLWSSTALVYFSGGSIEARFHVFVVIAAISLYQDWVPFGFAIVYAILSNGLSGQFGAGTLFGSGTVEQRHPWAWAAVEGAAILGAAIAQVVAWKESEDERSAATALATDLARAEEGAERRRVVGDLLVSLARRNQALLERQLEMIDELEGREQEPAALGDLFRLDHLATRMRRNAENLLVLSGSEPGRRWRDPLPASEVVRAAAAEIEDYPRVDIAAVDDPTISGRLVADLSHLLAELLENATAFSPPQTRVVVRGRLVRGGLEIRVEDSGVGMSGSDRATRNRHLAEAPETELDLTHALGLHVVARLAARHGITVALEAGAADGTTAVVVLPAAALHDHRSPEADDTRDEPAPDAHRPLPPPDAGHGPPPPVVIPTGRPQIPDLPWLGAVGGAGTVGAAAGLAAARVDAERRFLGADPRAPVMPPVPGPLGIELARRVPRSHLAPGIAAGPAPDAGRRGSRPDPDRIREQLGRYQRGVEEGRRSADAGEIHDGGDAPDGNGGPP